MTTPTGQENQRGQETCRLVRLDGQKPELRDWCATHGGNYYECRASRPAPHQPPTQEQDGLLEPIHYEPSTEPREGLFAAAREWLWRHSSQPDGDVWRNNPKHLDWAAANMLVDLEPWLVKDSPAVSPAGQDSDDREVAAVFGTDVVLRLSLDEYRFLTEYDPERERSASRRDMVAVLEHMQTVLRAARPDTTSG